MGRIGRRMDDSVVPSNTIAVLYAVINIVFPAKPKSPDGGLTISYNVLVNVLDNNNG
jgi:hypothetical protein